MIIHAHNFHYFIPDHAECLDELSRKYSIPIVLTIHNYWEEDLCRHLMRDIKWDKIVAVSYHMKSPCIFDSNALARSCRSTLPRHRPGQIPPACGHRGGQEEVRPHGQEGHLPPGQGLQVQGHAAQHRSSGEAHGKVPRSMPDHQRQRGLGGLRERAAGLPGLHQVA